MADQYGVTPKEYVFDLKNLLDERYSQGMLYLEATAEAFSSHCCYADAVRFYRSHSSTGETFHL